MLASIKRMLRPFLTLKTTDEWNEQAQASMKKQQFVVEAVDELRRIEKDERADYEQKLAMYRQQQMQQQMQQQGGFSPAYQGQPQRQPYGQQGGYNRGNSYRQGGQNRTQHSHNRYDDRQEERYKERQDSYVEPTRRQGSFDAFF
jgi:hypothetical protein